MELWVICGMVGLGIIVCLALYMYYYWSKREHEGS